MKILQLYREGKEMIASDGIMYVDGRLNHSSIIKKVKKRNKSFEQNFPHSVADEFAIYWDRIGSQLYNRTKL